MTMNSPLSTPTAALDFEFVTTQPTGQSLARVFLGSEITGPGGESVGDVHDLIFDHAGNINTVVIGVGGLLGIGEKTVAVPFSALTMTSGRDNVRIITLQASRDILRLAPIFTPTEKTTLDAIRDKAVDLGHKTADKANELRSQAAKRIDEMTKKQPGDK